MAEAMKGVTKAMGQMNRQMNLPALQKIMMEFERQNEKMEMTTEVMGDAIDDALEGDEEEEETEELVSQVLDEIGIDLDSQVTKLSLLLRYRTGSPFQCCRLSVIKRECPKELMFSVCIIDD